MKNKELINKDDFKKYLVTEITVDTPNFLICMPLEITKQKWWSIL